MPPLSHNLPLFHREVVNPVVKWSRGHQGVAAAAAGPWLPLPLCSAAGATNHSYDEMMVTWLCDWLVLMVG